MQRSTKICLAFAFALLLPMSMIHAANVKPGDNVQAVVSANQGGTVTFADGVYNIPKLNVGDITLSGSVNAVLAGPPNDYTVQLVGDNVNVNGLALAGASGIDFAGHRKNINLNGTVIREGANGCTGIRVLNGLENCTWINVTFNVPGNSIGIYNWISAPPTGSGDAWNAACPATWINWRVENCTGIGNTNGYAGQNEFAHIRGDTPAPPGKDNGPGKSTGGVFRNITITGFARCGIEYQGGATGTLFEGCDFEKPALSNSRPVNDGSMAYSLAADASVGTIVRHCKVVGDGRVSDGVGVRNGFECAGHGVICTDSYVEGVNNAAILNTSTDGVIAFNQFVNNLSGGVVSGSNAVRASIHDNSPTQALTWDPAGSPAVGMTPPPTTGGPWFLSKVGDQVGIGSPPVVDPGTHSVAGVDNASQTQLTTAGQTWHIKSYAAPLGVWEQVPTPPVPPVVTVDPIMSVVVTHQSGKVETVKP